MAIINPKFLFSDDVEDIKESRQSLGSSLAIGEDDVTITKAEINTEVKSSMNDSLPQDTHVAENHENDIIVELSKQDNQGEVKNEQNDNEDKRLLNNDVATDESDNILHYRKIIDYIKTLVEQFEQIKHLAVAHNIISQINESITEQIQALVNDKTILWDRRALDDIIASNYSSVVPYNNALIIVEKFLSNSKIKADVEKYKFYINNILVDKYTNDTLTSEDIEQLYNLALKHYRIMQLADSVDTTNIVKEAIALLKNEYESKFENISNTLVEHQNSIEEVKCAIDNLSSEIKDIQVTLNSLQETMQTSQHNIDESELINYLKPIVESVVNEMLKQYDEKINELMLRNDDLSFSIHRELDQIRQEMTDNMNTLSHQLNIFVEKTEEVISSVGNNNSSQDNSKYAEDIQMIIENIHDIRDELSSIMSRLSNMEAQVNTHQTISETNSRSTTSNTTSDMFSSQFIHMDDTEQEKFSYTPSDDDVGSETQDKNSDVVASNKVSGIMGLFQNTKMVFVVGAILLLLGILLIVKH